MAENFINAQTQWRIIEDNQNPAPARIDEVLAKAKEAKGLSPEETAALLGPMAPAQLDQLYQTAGALKEAIYGRRMVLFAPLYISNLCANQCSYCAFNATNKDLERKALNSAEITKEVEVLLAMGHKRVMAVYGEHPLFDAARIAQSVADIYAVTHGDKVRRVNVNAAPLEAEGFSLLKQAGIGTYQCFQETYHEPTYAKVHLGGKKQDFNWRLYAMHRAQSAGVDDVGLGVLFGLYDHRFEVLGLLAHALELEKEFGVGPHTISFPRIEPAQNSSISQSPPYAIDDNTFKRIISVVRLAMPYTGMIITTRENPAIKRELLKLGISQLSAASRTYPGAYADSQVNRVEAQQFWVGDSRSLQEIVNDLCQDGYIPSFCTSCYRLGRTGEHFMSLAKNAFISQFCQPNALTSFYEFLCDYATPELRQAGLELIENMSRELSDEQQANLQQRFTRINQGQRDLCL